MDAHTQLLSLENLGQFDDGLLAAAFAANLKLIISDLNDRPHDDRTRKLTVVMSFVPIALQNDLDSVKVEYKVSHNIAGHEGRECTLTPKYLDKRLQLAFAATGTDARQPGLPFDADD